jgi:glycosyltransferase involved in cell wall biosynthesis
MDETKQKLLIATGIFPPDIGGPATMLAHLARSLQERGFEVKIITYSEVPSPVIPAEAGIQVARINKNNKLKYFWQLWRLARGTDLIYATDTYSVGYFVYLIKKITGKKYVLRFTGDSAWETARTNGWTMDYIVDFQNKKYDFRIEKIKARRNKILFNADKIIVDCNFNRQLAEIIGVSAEKIEVVYNAVDFEKPHPDPLLRKERGTDGPTLSPYEGERWREVYNQIKQKFSPHGEKIILISCRLTPWKGVKEIIEVLPRLIEKIGPVNFVVLGEGNEMENLKIVSRKLSVENYVHFLGKVKHEETRAYFAVADCFVLNSQYEGASHALLDAMQIGVPIIATGVGGNPELIENNKDGILVEYGNNLELLNALVKILSDNPSCHSGPVSQHGVNSGGNPEGESFAKMLANNAREKAKKFVWEAVVEKTEKVLNNSIKK